MNSSFDFDSRLSSWLDEQAVPRAPDALLGQVVQRASHTRRRPAWATLERWISMETRAQLGAVPRTALILIILAVLLAVVSAIALAQQPSPRLPAPLGVARNGLIAFDDDGDIWVVKPDGSGRRRLTATPEWDVEPVWSRDGTHLAYWSEPDSNQDSTAALKVMDADGTNVRSLASDLTLSDWTTHVAWSHDGRFLAYSDLAGTAGLEVGRIMVVPFAGGDPVEVVSPGQGPTWSPDDKLIGYRGGGRTKDAATEPVGLMVVASDGTGKQLIDGSYTNNPYAFSNPQWSPDGRQLAYHAGLNGAEDIFVANVDQGGVTAITHRPSGGVAPVWSPDGARIAYDGPPTASNKYQVIVANPDGSNATTLDPQLGCNCGVQWSPDGTTVTAYQDGPVVGHEDTQGAMVLMDPTDVVPPLAIPYAGLSDLSVSWQRLAP